MIALSALLAVLVSAASAHASTIGAITRLKGQQENELIGLGIVIGLSGTGDTSGDSLAAVRPYAELLANLGNPVENASQLSDAGSFAIVAVSAAVPATGAHEGDRLDLRVDTLYNAESLEGGRLIPSLLRIPSPDAADIVPLAAASGAVVLYPGDETSGAVRGGGMMLRDVRNEVVGPNGVVTLVIESAFATYSVANAIASAINETNDMGSAVDRIAVARDARTIEVSIPEADQRDPTAFLDWMTSIRIDPSLLHTEARVVINRSSGVIVASPDVRVEPVAVAMRGLRFSQAPDLDGDRRWGGLSTTDGTGRRTESMETLLDGLNRINVPFEQQVELMYELKRVGAMHARIIEGR
ncbi:MAG: flagellar basal body P-ring protein FlgI [Phycisphaerales bacterium]